MDKKRIIDYKKELMVPEGGFIQIEANIDTQTVTFLNFANNHREVVKLSESLKN